MLEDLGLLTPLFFPEANEAEAYKAPGLQGIQGIVQFWSGTFSFHTKRSGLWCHHSGLLQKSLPKKKTITLRIYGTKHYKSSKNTRRIHTNLPQAWLWHVSAVHLSQFFGQPPSSKLSFKKSPGLLVTKPPRAGPSSEPSLPLTHFKGLKTGKKQPTKLWSFEGPSLT